MVAPARQLSDANVGGTGLGQSATDLISLYGQTPVTQPSGAALSATLSLFVMTGASFVANTSSTLSGFIVLNTTLAAQLIDTIIAIRAALAGVGVHKGGA